MWFIFVLSWLATFVHVCLATLALASGLYYLAEIVEEYTVITLKIIRWLLIVTAGIYVGLILFEDLPFHLTITGLISVGIYSLLLRNFPFIELTSPVFIFSCVLVIVNHYIAFRYFAEVWHPFSEVIGYFTLCLWLVPFSFFISLSANDNVLPTTHLATETTVVCTCTSICAGQLGLSAAAVATYTTFVHPHVISRHALGIGGKEDVVTSYFNRRSKRSGILSVFDMVRDTLIPERSKRF